MSIDVHLPGQITERDVFARLEHLERAVNVPMVSGESAQWLESVAAAAKEVEATTCQYFRTVHPDLYRQISEHDPEQNPRVQNLEQEDEEICAGLHALAELAEKLQGVTQSAEPDEHRIAKVTKELSDRVIANVLRVRKHETQISTWHVEAMLRDRGEAD